MVENFVLQKLLDAANTDKIPKNELEIIEVQEKQRKIYEGLDISWYELKSAYVKN